MSENETGRLFADIEFQTAVLVRNLEMLKRRNNFYKEVDRSGYLLLRTLNSTEPLTIGGLAAVLGLDPSTVARQVGVVHSAGLVTKTPHPDDRRRSIITITEAGEHAVDAVRRRRTEGTTQILDAWATVDLRVLSDMFTRYNYEIADHYGLAKPAVDTARPKSGGPEDAGS